MNGQKEILVNFQNDAKRYIYIYIYIYVYLYEKNIIGFQRHHFIYFGYKHLLYIYRDAVKIINLPVEIVRSLPHI